MAGNFAFPLVGNWPQLNNSSDSLNLNALGLPPELALQEQKLNKRQQLANVLMQRSLQPLQGEMAGRYYAPPSWTQGLAQLGAAAAGIGIDHANDRDRAILAGKSNAMLGDALREYQQQTAPRQVSDQMPVDPNLVPPTFDIDKMQPDTFQQVQNNKNAIALTTSPPEQPLAGIPQRMNPWTMELVGQPSGIPQPSPIADALQQKFDQGQQYTRQAPPELSNTVPVNMRTVERTPEENKAALVQLMASQHPQAKAIGQLLMQQEAAKEEKASQREFTAQQNELNRDVQREKMSSQLDQMVMLKLMTQQQADEMRAKMDQQAQLNRENALAIAKVGAGSREKAAEIKAQQAENKPMPASAAQRQAEHLDAIGTAAAIKSDLSALRNQVDSGKINLGFVSNWLSRGKNAAGFSDEQSRNFSSFVNTLEKMRNDSLRLNKGVQTEGDAQRAWNELFQSINDPGLVKQRLQEIESINDRAVNLQKLQVDTLRENFKQPPFDFSKYETQPPAVGQGAAPSTGGWSIRPIQ